MHRLDSPPPTPLSPDHTIKRLHFEDILLDMSPRAQIRRDFDRCLDDVPDPTEVIESLKSTAAQYADVDPSKLWEEYLRLKREFVRTRAENLFLESFIDPESAIEDVPRSDLEAVENQLAELRSMSMKEAEEIASLVRTFAAEMENFPQLIESVLNYFDECDRKFQSQDGLEQSKDDMNIHANSDLECKVRELRKLAEEVETQIIGLEADNSKQEEYFRHLQSLHETHTKLDLLRRVLTFFSDWIVESCEDNLVILTYRGSAFRQKKAISIKHPQSTKESTYKLRVKIEMKSLFVEEVQLEPKHHASSIDDILKEMAFRRMMHSVEASCQTHNDLEFLLRRVSQRIADLNITFFHWKLRISYDEELPRRPHGTIRTHNLWVPRRKPFTTRLLRE